MAHFAYERVENQKPVIFLEGWWRHSVILLMTKQRVRLAKPSLPKRFKRSIYDIFSTVFILSLPLQVIRATTGKITPHSASVTKNSINVMPHPAVAQVAIYSPLTKSSLHHSSPKNEKLIFTKSISCTSRIPSFPSASTCSP